MLARLKDQPLAFVAIFLLIAGSAFAAAGAPRPGGPDSTPNAPNIGKGKGAIPNGSVTAKDLSPELRQQISQPGAPGKKGAAGAPGAPGAPGAAGPTGLRGVVGADGADGADGANGAAGASGANGTNGSTGAVGPTGPAGAQGVPGPTGPAGSSATADGTAVIMGRTDKPAGQDCVVFSPSGLSTAAACTGAGEDSRRMLVPTARVLRGTVAFDSGVPAGATVYLIDRTTSSTVLGSCTTGSAGATQCSFNAFGSIPAGMRLVLKAEGLGTGAGNGISFGFELLKP